MAGSGPSWLIDPNRIATKIRSASGALHPGKVDWKSNPTKSCPNCQHVIDNSDVVHAWPGLPRGVKFDPSDQEIIWHLLAKVGLDDIQPHPFTDEFIPTVQEDDGICYTHPQNLPGVTQDGSVSHFFHRAIKAYSTGTRKRRKIHVGDDLGDVRWHKTGRTKAVWLDGVQKGCKKIMVLYVSPVRGGKAEKTNWVMHQYHLGTAEDEREGEFVLSKVFYQQQVKQPERIEEDCVTTMVPKVDPVTPKLLAPDPHAERRLENQAPLLMRDRVGTPSEPSDDQSPLNPDVENNDDEADDEDGGKLWENESPFLLNSQQLVEGLSLFDDLLQSQSPCRDENGNSHRAKPLLSAEDLRMDLEACRDLASDPANIYLDTPPDFRLSQLEFESQESYIAWGGSARGEGKMND